MKDWSVEDVSNPYWRLAATVALVPLAAVGVLAQAAIDAAKGAVLRGRATLVFGACVILGVLAGAVEEARAAWIGERPPGRRE